MSQMTLFVYHNPEGAVDIEEHKYIVGDLGIRVVKAPVWVVLAKTIRNQPTTIESLPLLDAPETEQMEKLRQYFEDKYANSVKLKYINTVTKETEVLESATAIKIKKEGQSIVDSEGNKIYYKGNDSCFYLKLASGVRERKLGQYVKGRLVVKRNRQKHLFRKNSSYGFNYHLLKETSGIKFVELSDNIDSWLVPKAYILTHGEFLNFKEQGFELQTFITLDKLNESAKD